MKRDMPVVTPDALELMGHCIALRKGMQNIAGLNELIETITERVLNRVRQEVPDANGREFYSPAEVAKMTGLSSVTLLSWRQRGEGPPWSKAGRRVLYRRADFERWLSTNPRGGSQ